VVDSFVEGHQGLPAAPRPFQVENARCKIRDWHRTQYTAELGKANTQRSRYRRNTPAQQMAKRRIKMAKKKLPDEAEQKGSVIEEG
jgi:hypothetical protein